MSEQVGIIFDCPACGKHFSWRPELAGKKVKCPCGAVMIAPAPPGEVYDVAEDPVMAAPVVLASRTKPLNPGAVVSHQGVRVLAYRSKGAKHENALEADVVEFARLRDFWAPIGLIGLGILLQIGVAIYEGIASGDLFGKLGPTVAGLVIHFVLFFLAMLFAVKLLDIPFGEPYSALLKLSAIALAPAGVGGAIAFFMGNDSFSQIASSVCIQPGLTYILFVVLFGLEVGQVLMCVILTYLVHDWITVFFVQKLFPSDL